MGIGGLIVFVKSGGQESAIRKGHISEFKGKRAGVDVYSWLHKSIFTCAFDLFIGKPTTKYVEFCMRQLKLISNCGVIPVLVFDGCNMPFKVVDQKRHEERQCAKRQAKDLIAAGKQSEAFKYIVKSVDITHEMAYEVIKAARAINIDCIVAPYEADAQLAFLQKEKYIDVIITEDSDLIVFGCETIFYKMTPSGEGEIYEKKKLPAAATRPNIRFKEFNFEKFRHAAIMSGCDYVKNLPGIGLTKAWKFMNITEINDVRLFLKKVPSYLKMKITVDEDYINDFIMADMSFRYQYVFDPAKLQRVTFNPVDEYTDDFKKFADSFTPVEVDQIQLALGNMDRNNRVYGHFNLNNVPLNSIFRSTFVEIKRTEPQINQEPISFPEIRIGTRKRQIKEPLQEITAEVEDKEIMNLYRSSKIVKQENTSPSPPLSEPERKKPRKCKFVISTTDSVSLTTSKYFSKINKENVINDSIKNEVIDPTVINETIELNLSQVKNISLNNIHNTQQSDSESSSNPSIDDEDTSMMFSLLENSSISAKDGLIATQISEESSEENLVNFKSDNNSEPSEYVKRDEIDKDILGTNNNNKTPESITCTPDTQIDFSPPLEMRVQKPLGKKEIANQKKYTSNTNNKRQQNKMTSNQSSILSFFKKREI